jgi:hypothetical protein
LGSFLSLLQFGGVIVGLLSSRRQNWAGAVKSPLKNVELLPRLAAWSAHAHPDKGRRTLSLSFIFAPRDPSWVTKGVSFFGNKKISAQR